MRRFVAPVAFGVFALLFAARQPAGQAQSPQQTLPRFVAGVDVVEMDVSVLDKDRKPIRGLTAQDFTVLEDGKPQRIVAFSEENEEPPAPPSAPWMRDVAPDVENNQLAQHAVFAVVIDDALLWLGRQMWAGVDMWRLNAAKAMARQLIAGLGKADAAAVVFTSDNWNGQSFTTDHSKLLRAVETTQSGREVPIGIDCAPLWGTTGVLRDAVEALSTIERRRKVVFFISPGVPLRVGHDMHGCYDRANMNVLETIHTADRSNVNVYGMDPSGLKAYAGDSTQVEFLTNISSVTGGRAIIETNDQLAAIPAILEETRSYYLLGYALANRQADGLFHQMSVKVNRPGAEVHARKVRHDPLPEESGKRPATSGEASAVGDFLPSAELRMEVTAAPFATRGPESRVFVALNVQLPAGVAPTTPRDKVTLLIRAFTPDGRDVTSAHESYPVTLESGTPAGPATVGFDLASQLALKPGRYAVRIGVSSETAGKGGSVYTDVIVPDFSKEPVSLSGVILTASSGSSLRGDALNTLVPTTTRAFEATDRIQAFLRVYQGGGSTPAAVLVRTRIVDEHDALAMNRTETLRAQAFTSDRQADYFLRLPLSTLKPGEYWLSIEATVGKTTAKRDVRFSVK
jgi:VWFA-related protein